MAAATTMMATDGSSAPLRPLQPRASSTASASQRAFTCKQQQQQPHPAKLSDDEDDEDDEDGYDQRTSDWNASTLRKELGSPRMTSNSVAKDTNPAVAIPTADGVKQQQSYRTGRTQRGASFLQELGSALVSCGGGGHGATSTMGGSRDQGSASLGSDSHDRWGRLKESLQKVVHGDLDAAKEALSSATCNTGGSVPFYVHQQHQHPHGHHHHHGICKSPSNGSQSQDESILTYEEHYPRSHRHHYSYHQQEEEAMQLQRLTSWGTNGTMDTWSVTKYVPLKTSSSVANPPKSNGEAPNKTPARPRVVRFDYPPISSLRECPRTNPDHIQDLFFTEGELEQIEDDRDCTRSADDVEIVAISTSTDETDDGGVMDEPPMMDHHAFRDPAASMLSPSNTASDHFRNYVATPILKGAGNKHHHKEPRKGKRAFSFENTAAKAGVSANPSLTSSATASTASSSKKRSSVSRRQRRNSNPEEASSRSPLASRRMIKSVQIYLRERSGG